MKGSNFSSIDVLIAIVLIIFLLVIMCVIRSEMGRIRRDPSGRSLLAEIAASVESYHADTDMYPPDYISTHLDEDADGKERNLEESAKALYDFLCTPMKGRRDEIGKQWSGIMAYYEPDPSFVTETGSGEGWGALTPDDSKMLVDPWGNSIRYISAVEETQKTVSSKDAGTEMKDHVERLRQKAQKKHWVPWFNKDSFDLWSPGPDGREYDHQSNPNDENDVDNDNIRNWVEQ